MVYTAGTQTSIGAEYLVQWLQHRGDVHGQNCLKQHFAEMAFFSRARTTGKMGEVVNKLKANLRYAGPSWLFLVPFVYLRNERVAFPF